MSTFLKRLLPFSRSEVVLKTTLAGAIAAISGSLVLASGKSAWAATEKVLNIALSAEPPQLNSTKATDQQSGFVLGHVMEGLTSYGKKEGELIPGVAEKWELSDQQAVFHLRKNAKWSDGKPVTAKDFVFAWRTALEPKNASEYAFILYPIKNGEAVNTGKLPSSELGAQAIDDLTLKVTFEKPCGYFLGLTAFSTYLPIREDFYQTRKDRYGADAGDLLYNGAFRLTKWVHGAELQMERNPHYWNSEAIRLTRINVPYITSDSNTQFNLFKDRKIDLMERLGKTDLEKSMIEHLRISSFPDGSLWYMEFNHRKGRATANLNLRKAIAAIYNPTEYVSQIVGIPKTRPAAGLIPAWLKGVKAGFREEYKLPQPKPDSAKAKQYLAQALKELNLTSPPSLVWLTGDTEGSHREAEYFQKRFKDELGIHLKIDKQIFKQRLAKMTAGDFDIVAAGWGPDFADPMTFAELKASWNENNRGKWSNAEYDRQIRIAQSTSDQKTRMEAMAAAERILIEDLGILPTFERTQMYLNSARVTGVQRRAIGPDPYLVYADIK